MRLMFRFGLILTLNWVFVYGYPQQNNRVNDTNLISGLIISGSRAHAGDAPEAVAVRWRDGSIHCSGTIFHKHWVMSAAHCGPNQNDVGDFVVVAGDLHFESISKSRSVHDIVRSVGHPGYSRQRLGYDMRLLKVEPDFKFDDLYIKRAPIANCRFNIGHLCRFAGWGMTYQPHPEDDYLHYMKIAVSRVGNRNEVFFKDPHQKANICHGDSGGGYMCDGLLTAVGSAYLSPGMCTGRVESMGPNVRRQREWIEEVIGEKLPADEGINCVSKTKSASKSAASLPSLPAKGPVWFLLLWGFIMLQNF